MDATAFAGTAVVPIVVKAGVSSVTIRVPKGVHARVTSSSGLSAIDVSKDLASQLDGSWQTPGYGKTNTSAGYDISIESGVGSVSIQTY